MLGSYMDDMGISADQFEAACAKGKAGIKTQFQQMLFEQVICQALPLPLNNFVAYIQILGFMQSNKSIQNHLASQTNTLFHETKLFHFKSKLFHSV